MINPKLLNGKLEIESEDIMGIFTTKSKGKNTNNEECNIILHLNMRLMPVDRGSFLKTLLMIYCINMTLGK